MYFYLFSAANFVQCFILEKMYGCSDAIAGTMACWRMNTNANSRRRELQK